MAIGILIHLGPTMPLQVVAFPTSTGCFRSCRPWAWCLNFDLAIGCASGDILLSSCAKPVREYWDASSPAGNNARRSSHSGQATYGSGCGSDCASRRRESLQTGPRYPSPTSVQRTLEYRRTTTVGLVLGAVQAHFHPAEGNVLDDHENGLPRFPGVRRFDHAA